MCTKVSRYTERSYHPQRVLHPLKRSGPKCSGQFERVGWGEALSDIARRLRSSMDRGLTFYDCTVEVAAIAEPERLQ